ncbi:DUF6412 domain-containing protein [Streptomyces sp. TRM 70351]|uniref:DUF6412 domain-containing protein n=1 Tax=Streptomyces sp. TRM 70351 TaxID=3116552 RepID=UPI002E7C0928|nr:DUF6412 domain-containing protein [Streptomyces sp. TRM 70351]MEE1926978.1 DUF6412 domain-containing protein [Streptomyces sp. TRM 70351]
MREAPARRARVVRLGAALAVLVLLTDLFLTPAGGAVPVAAAACAAVLVLCVALAAPHAPPPLAGRVRTALRDRALRTAFLTQRDPDAAGRPRPRAPGRRPTTAV